MIKISQRKIKSAKQLLELWEAFKYECDNKEVLTHSFSAKNSEYVSKNLKKCITYTIEGFCVFIGIAKSNFYAHYAENERYKDVVTHIREECEQDVRAKFELGMIPTQLAPLWMSKFGYSTKADINADVDNRVVIVDDIKD